MRITAEEKVATRRRILDAAIQAFRARGFRSTTTRDIAEAAGIGTGTLFNYFATKEAIVEFLAEQAIAKARAGFARQAIEAELEEELFAYVALELRQLKPLRSFITPLLESSLCPHPPGRRPEPNNCLRDAHLEIVADLVRKHRRLELPPIAWQVYWTLYTGVLAFWASDKSPKQEDTLALLNESLAMYVAWLRSEPGGTR